MLDKHALQKIARPYGGQPSAEEIRMFNQVQEPTEGAVVPLTTFKEYKRRNPHGLSGAALKAFWAEAFAADNMTLEDLYPYRVKAAWRIVREWACLVGLITSRDTPLRDVCEVSPSPLTNRGFRYGSQVPPDSFVANLIKDARGLPLLPPSIPKSARGNPEYAPRRDTKLVRWCTLVNYIGTTRLALGSTKEGRYGLAGLGDPNLARIAMPSAVELYAMEDLLVREALKQIIDRSDIAAMDMLRTKHMLFEHEVKQIMAMARIEVTSYANLNVESQRAQIMVRLERYLDNFNEQLDYRGAIFAIREMAKIGGLHQNASDGNVDDMVKDAQLVNSSKNPKKILPPPPKT